jgi:hypothetical protein
LAEKGADETMIKLYRKIKKRLAKKLIGNYRWKILQCYANGELTIGSIIHTCKGYNQVVVDLTSITTNKHTGFPNSWKVRRLKRGYYVYDIDVATTTGSCSLKHCCWFPAISKEEILTHFKERAKVDSKWDFGDQDKRLIAAVKNGEDPFDEKGCVKKEYLA